MRLKNVLGEGSGERIGSGSSLVNGLTDDGKRPPGCWTFLVPGDEIEEKGRGSREREWHRAASGRRAGG